MYRSPQKNFPIEKKIGPLNHRVRRTIMRSINNLHVIATIVVENLENRFHQKFQQKSWQIEIKSRTQRSFSSKKFSNRKENRPAESRRVDVEEASNDNAID